jgi:hypothetical protein
LPDGLPVASTFHIHEDNLRVPDDLEACAKNLRKIHRAVAQYAKDNGSLPDWLSDLVPRYLTIETLVCPADTGTAPRKPPDRHPKCSYGYPLAAYPFPWGGLYRDLYVEEMKVYGGVFPLARCRNHGFPQRILNVAMNGQVYVGYPFWKAALVGEDGKRVQLPQPTQRPAAPRPVAAGKLAIPEANLEIPDELKPCGENLQIIHEAINKYRSDKGDFPRWLSDLVPGYLKAGTLLCPVHPERRAQLNPDPMLASGYEYQYSDSRFSSGTWTYREFKDVERKIFGELVPLVRCHNHGERYMNLAFDRQVYISGRGWERLFIPQLPSGTWSIASFPLPPRLAGRKESPP